MSPATRPTLPEPLLTCSRYQILTRSLTAPASPRLLHDPTLDLHLSTHQDRLVEELCQHLRSQGRRVERLPVYRVGTWKWDAKGLSLPVGHTDYGVALAQRLRPEWWGQRLPTLAVCALTLCGDSAILEQRSHQVAVSAGLCHVKPSGNLQPPESPEQGLAREALEELELTSEELSPPRWLGMVLCHETLLDLVYCWLATPSFEQVLARTGTDAWEHDALSLVDCEAEALATWCRENYFRASPPAHAAFILEGWNRYGLGWLEGLWPDQAKACWSKNTNTPVTET